MNTNGAPSVGIVAIGRNEGERLRRCLKSVVGRADVVVYVDSRSTDGSVEMAKGLGVEVVELDLSTPFTAARARNAGFDRLQAIAPGLRYVQFVDGDCEVVDGWLDLALAELETRPDVAVVCGRRRERHPQSSIYNRLADIEWETPVGETRACGGDALIRVEPLREVGAYDPTLIAGEEPDLCVRLRALGWKVWRLDAEMTLHDMDMTRFGQWWRRAVRAGYAYAEGAARHGRPPERHRVREVRSLFFWGLALPIVALALVWPTRGLSLALFGAYPLQSVRIAGKARRRGFSNADAWLYAAGCMLGKFPQTQGLLRYWLGRIVGRRSTLIEYRTDPIPGPRRSKTADLPHPEPTETSHA